MGILKQPYFRGQSIHRLDAKGRLRIPTRFREVLQNHYTDALIVTLMGECLVAYPPEIWDKIEAKALEFSQVQPQQRAFIRYFISSAVTSEFDNQGRILIPPMLREKANLDQEILLAGMLTSFEIWDKGAWTKHLELNKDQYDQMMETMAGAGL
ncbi:MAG: division/cell wall cluster transcriptional repressor MraZ [Syntrophobacteraceae bacterium]